MGLATDQVRDPRVDDSTGVTNCGANSDGGGSDGGREQLGGEDVEGREGAADACFADKESHLEVEQKQLQSNCRKVLLRRNQKSWQRLTFKQRKF